MTTRVTSFTMHQTAEGMRGTFTYSVIDEDGNLVKSNERATIIVLDDNINNAIFQINEWLLKKVPS